ncbi:hypothetical protein [Almyronema epifaneia]|uniref:Uncharacterized protein n=1 Tax=Almyronema epifaneia S1 TaxID=2991925 RepID=A0ABW6IJM2_9CYAN
MAGLRGLQLAVLPEVEPYEIENPCPLLTEVNVGERCQFYGRIGTLASYESGYVVFCSEDQLQLFNRRVAEGLQESPPEQSAQRSPKRRHSPKGQASGWLEERVGNKKRKNPTTSYYYCWDEVIQPGETRRQKVYVKVRKMMRLRQMIDERRSVHEILAFLDG